MEMTIDQLNLTELNAAESTEISGGIVQAIVVSLVAAALYDFANGVVDGIRQSAP